MPPAPEIVGPASSFFVSQRLRLHYVDWGNVGEPTAVLVHGGRDHSRSWDATAMALRDRFHVIAPDLRGHGDSAWVIGSNYPIIDFVLDLAQLVDVVDEPDVTLIGHSFGGVIATHYTSVRPERVGRLVNIEGFGPPPELIERWRRKPMWQQTEEWFQQMRKLASRLPRRYTSIDDAAARMQQENPSLSPGLARHLTVHGVARNEDGSYSWKFDNYFRSMPPREWRPESQREMWSRIVCPTLLVRGGDSWAADPRADGRAALLARGSYVEIPGAGHFVHHDRFDDFIAALGAFLDADARDANSGASRA